MAVRANGDVEVGEQVTPLTQNRSMHLTLLRRRKQLPWRTVDTIRRNCSDSAALLSAANDTVATASIMMWEVGIDEATHRVVRSGICRRTYVGHIRFMWS